MLRKLMAVLAVIAVVLVALPAHAAPTAEDRGDALLRLTDWVSELVGQLAVLVGAEEAGPEMDPNGGTQAATPSSDPQEDGGLLDPTTEAGPEMDPNG